MVRPRPDRVPQALTSVLGEFPQNYHPEPKVFDLCDVFVLVEMTSQGWRA
jgi:hypothetical protein